MPTVYCRPAWSPVLRKSVTTPLLEVKNLATHFFTEEGVVKAVDQVDFSVYPGKVLGVVGESGCGKSMTSLSILRLVPGPQGKIVRGEINFHGKNLLDLSEREMRAIRGNKISLISQDPMTSLNPVLTVGEQIMEAIRLHQGLNKADARKKAISMLEDVGIPGAASRIDEYPHQFSGGMRQRVIIAMALSCEPELLIADEPTTALDVTIQAQILDLMRKIRDERNAAIVLITHDLGVVAEMCDDVVVMYAGKVVEHTDVYTLFANPGHPYTKGLLQSIPQLHEVKDRLQPIEGQPPSLSRLPKGCAFAPRCPEVGPECLETAPELKPIGPNQQVRCLKRG
ncbi:MAG: ABC transporter ATP-binding protein [Candidatus Sericytochromatia bacterium]|nr:ABC transporter ATP-binding protein [Candidatus Sericytochromatia bacterium]